MSVAGSTFKGVELIRNIERIDFDIDTRKVGNAKADSTNGDEPTSELFLFDMEF
jgi:hypothetical protein